MTEADPERLATAVRKRRAELGLTQAEVATLGGPSDTTLGKVEAAIGLPSRQTLMKLDVGLRWVVGSARRVLEGGDPVERSAGSVVEAVAATSKNYRNRIAHGDFADVTLEQMWLAWSDATQQVFRIEAEFARRRGISLEAARDELEEALTMARRRVDPWVPAWERARGVQEAGRRGLLRDVGAAAYDGEPELSDPADEVHP